jgi:hypothetical protein
MAVKQVDRTKTTKMWGNKIPFPKDNYVLRCVSQEFKPNSNNNPMVTLEWEIVNQEPKQIGADLIEFDGLKFSSYHVIKVLDDEEASNKAFNRFCEMLEKCGIDTSEGIDDENPPSLKSKIVYACVYGREQPSYASPTPEERAKGLKVGKVLKDPITKKDVINYQPTIEQIYGLFDGEVKTQAAPF